MKEGGKKEQFYEKHKGEIAAFTETYIYYRAPLKTVKIVATDSSPMREIRVFRYSLRAHLHTAPIFLN
jgi:hypothetical protein